MCVPTELPVYKKKAFKENVLEGDYHHNRPNVGSSHLNMQISIYMYVIHVHVCNNVCMVFRPAFVF